MAVAIQQIEQIDPRKANVLVPTQQLQQVSPWHAARTSVVVINPDPNSGDVYKVGSRWNPEKKATEDLFSPAKPALMRIAAAAGIVWNWRESGPISLTRDYVSYKAVGALRLPDGSWQPIMAVKEIDLTVIEEEQLEQNLRKAQDLAADPKGKAKLGGLTPEQWAQAQTRTAMVQWRKNKLMRAETGAMLRVIRAALGMKSQYTKEELERPFIVPRIDFSPDYNDPAVRQALIENGIQTMAQLFGQASPATLQPGPFSASHPALTAVSPAADETDEVEPVQEETAAEAEGDQEPQPQAQTAAQPAGATATPPVQGEPPKPEANQAQAQVGQASLLGEESEAPKCAVCGASVTDNVARYSQKKFGRIVCYRCQKNGGQAA